jgi:hypothetical protein
MSKSKPVADIFDWDIVFTGEDNQFALVGEIRNHDRQTEFHTKTQVTSKLLRIDFVEGRAETVNTIYRLGGEND